MNSASADIYRFNDRRHSSCPDCKCPPASSCNLCNGLGFVTEFKQGEPYDRGDGVMYGSGSWTSKPCPNGCPQPRLYS